MVSVELIQIEIGRLTDQIAHMNEHIALLQSGKMVITMNGANVSEETVSDHMARIETNMTLISQWEKLLAQGT